MKQVSIGNFQSRTILELIDQWKYAAVIVIIPPFLVYFYLNSAWL